MPKKMPKKMPMRMPRKKPWTETQKKDHSNIMKQVYIDKPELKINKSNSMLGKGLGNTYAKKHTYDSRSERAEFKRRQDVVYTGVSCEMCGMSSEESVCTYHKRIEFHHPLGVEKCFEVGESVYNLGISLEELLLEKEKTIPLCVRCHKIVYWKERKAG